MLVGAWHLQRQIQFVSKGPGHLYNTTMIGFDATPLAIETNW